MVLPLEPPGSIAGDMNTKLGKNNQQGVTTAGDKNSEGRNNLEQGGALTVIIAAGVPCSIIGLILFVAIGICIGWLIRHVQPHEKKFPGDGRMPVSDNANPRATQLQVNSTGRQQFDNREPIRINSRMADISNQANVRSHSEAHSQIQHEDQGIETISNYVAYLQGNQTCNVDVNSAVPPSHKLPTLPHETIPDEEEHLYEYIL